jgi:hypothetical protein
MEEGNKGRRQEVKAKRARARRIIYLLCMHSVVEKIF